MTKTALISIAILLFPILGLSIEKGDLKATIDSGKNYALLFRFQMPHGDDLYRFSRIDGEFVFGSSHRKLNETRSSSKERSLKTVGHVLERLLTQSRPLTPTCTGNGVTIYFLEPVMEPTPFLTGCYGRESDFQLNEIFKIFQSIFSSGI